MSLAHSQVATSITTTTRKPRDFERMRAELANKKAMEINGKFYIASSVPENASAEEILKQIAKENKWMILEVYFPKYKQSYLVGIYSKKDNIAIISNETNLIKEALEGQNIPNSDKEEIISISEKSTGALHLESPGGFIPTQIDANGKIVFPNQREWVPDTHFTVTLSDSKFDPKTIQDYELKYGEKSSNLAKFACAHGENRTGEIVLNEADRFKTVYVRAEDGVTVDANEIRERVMQEIELKIEKLGYEMIVAGEVRNSKFETGKTETQQEVKQTGSITVYARDSSQNTVRINVGFEITRDINQREHQIETGSEKVVISSMTIEPIEKTQAQRIPLKTESKEKIIVAKIKTQENVAANDNAKVENSLEVWDKRLVVNAKNSKTKIADIPKANEAQVKKIRTQKHGIKNQVKTNETKTPKNKTRSLELGNKGHQKIRKNRQDLAKQSSKPKEKTPAQQQKNRKEKTTVGTTRKIELQKEKIMKNKKEKIKDQIHSKDITKAKDKQKIEVKWNPKTEETKKSRKTAKKSKTVEEKAAVVEKSAKTIKVKNKVEKKAIINLETLKKKIRDIEERNKKSERVKQNTTKKEVRRGRNNKNSKKINKYFFNELLGLFAKRRKRVNKLKKAA